MLSSSGDSDKLFAKLIPVTIKEGISNQCRSSSLFLTVEWQETSSAIHRKELLITLTDNNDPFFLYNLHLSEEDFQMLKSSQDILVDFSAFPQKLMEYIEPCFAIENSAQPKFSLFLNMGEKLGTGASTAHLNVVETNPFKLLIHLSLKFMEATDSSVKQYLAACFRNIKEEKRVLQNRLCFLEKDLNNKLSTCHGLLEEKSQELESVRKKLSEELSLKESKHTRELQEERDRFLSKQREEENRLEKEKLEKEQNLKKQIQQLETRVSCLDVLNKEIQDKNHRQDGTIRDLRARALSMEEESKRLKDSLHRCKEQNKNFQVEISEKQLHTCHQKDKIEELERDVYHKRQHVNELQEELNAYYKQMKKLEKDLEDIKEQFLRKEKLCADLEKDISKANHVIEKLQHEIQNGHEKLRSWNKLSSKHENNLKEKEKVIQMLNKDLTDCKLDCKKKSNEIKNLSDTLTSIQEKLAQVKKELKTKQNMNEYLQRQLTDRCINSSYVPPPYIPPPNLVANYPILEAAMKLQSTSDPGGPKVIPTVTATNSGNRKSLPPRYSNSNAENGIYSQQKLQVSVTAADSAYSSSPSCNTKSTGFIASNQNDNQTNLEIDSQALSAAFGADRVLKHSTAKKQTNVKGLRTSKKS